jgi:hypothetical protein
MDAVQPDPPTTQTYWQTPGHQDPTDELVARLRTRVVALVAALVIQALIALFGVLPAVTTTDWTRVSDSSWYEPQPVSFWLQFAVLEFLAAVVVSLGLGPVVRVRTVPLIGRLVLGAAFVAVPAALIALRTVEQVRSAYQAGTTAAATSLLTTTFFTILFFGLPLIALAVPGSRPGSDPSTT